MCLVWFHSSMWALCVNVQFYSRKINFYGENQWKTISVKFVSPLSACGARIWSMTPNLLYVIRSALQPDSVLWSLRIFHVKITKLHPENQIWCNHQVCDPLSSGWFWCCSIADEFLPNLLLQKSRRSDRKIGRYQVFRDFFYKDFIPPFLVQ